MNVVIVGVGALGSHVSLALRNTAQLKVIDMDRVEQKNIMSQFHSKNSVGTNKTNSLKQSMLFLFGTKTEAIPYRLTQDNVHQLLDGADLIIDCLDNGNSRRIVQNYVRKTSIPCLHGGLAAGGIFGRVIWDENFVIDDEISGAQATCEDGEFLPFIMVVSSLMAQAAQSFLKHGKKHGFHVSPSSVISV